MKKYDIFVIAKKEIPTMSGFNIPKGTHGKMNLNSREHFTNPGGGSVSYDRGGVMAAIDYDSRPLMRSHWQKCGSKSE